MIIELAFLVAGAFGISYGAWAYRALRSAQLQAPPEPPLELSKTDAESLLPNAVSARFGQDGVLWTIIGSFWSTNAVLLVALGATGEWPEVPSLPRVICATGVFVSYLWLVMQNAALRRVIYYERLTTRLEGAMGIPVPARLFGSHPENSVHGAPTLPFAREIMPYGPKVALVAWVTGTIVALAA